MTFRHDHKQKIWITKAFIFSKLCVCVFFGGGGGGGGGKLIMWKVDNVEVKINTFVIGRG